MVVANKGQPPDLSLPLTLLSRYLFFLSRRPISASNTGFLIRRLYGLKNLATLLQNRDDPELDEVGARLLELTPANLFRHGTAIQRLLRRRTAEALPRDLVVTGEQPPEEFWQAVRRCLIILGPSIGIGDEIITFLMPSCLKQLMPEAEIAVLSMYKGLWDCVECVHAVKTYSNAVELLSALRNPDTNYNLVIFADFERSDLLGAIASEPAVPRYIELSLGGRSLTVLDNERREVFRMPHPEPYFANFYDCFDRMMSWLGVETRLPRHELLKGRSQRNGFGDDFVIAISPFTSKEDPSERYWSRLLAEIVPSEIKRRIRIVIDTGATEASASFALALSRSARVTTHPNVLHQVAHCQPGSNVPLAEMMCCFGDADIVITADSFPAHAAPLFNRLTIVIARNGTEHWHAPSPNSFYLPAEATEADLAGAVRAILREYVAGPLKEVMFTPRQSRECRKLRESSTQLEKAMVCEAAWKDLRDLWTQFAGCYADVLAAIRNWPEPYSLLFSDRNYQDLWTAFPSRDTPQARMHIASRFGDWSNSNLQKYLAFHPGGADV